MSFTHKMAAKISWHRYGTKLRHCHPKYTGRAHVQVRASRGTTLRPAKGRVGVGMEGDWIGFGDRYV